jgi:hypothetical protein
MDITPKMYNNQKQQIDYIGWIWASNLKKEKIWKM